MFTQYIYNIDGRKRSRFFQSWDHANSELIKEYKGLLERHPDAVTVYDYDYYNTSKGFPVRQIGLLIDGVSFTLSLIDCYFED